MWSRGGAARLFFLISRWLRLRDSQAAVFQIENIASPVDAIAHKTCSPDHRRNQISQGQQDNVAECLSVVEHTLRSDESDGESGSESHCQQCPRPCRPAGREQRGQCPGQAKGEKQSCVPPATGIPDGPRPAQLMAKK